MKTLLGQVVETHPIVVTPEMPLPEAIAICVTDPNGERDSNCALETDGFFKLSSMSGRQASRIKSSCAIVANDDGPIGMLSICEILSFVASEKNWEEIKIESLALQPIVTLIKSEIENIYSIITLFKKSQVSYLVIINNQNNIVGAISQERLFQVLDSAAVMSELKDDIRVTRSVIPLSNGSQRPVSQPARVHRRQYLTHSPKHLKAKSRNSDFTKNRQFKKNSRHTSKWITRNFKRSKRDELRLQHQRAKLFSEVTLKIQQSLQLNEIINTAVREVKRILQVDRVLIYQVFPNGTGRIISEAVLPIYPETLGVDFPEEVFPTDYQELYSQGRIQSIPNIHDPHLEIAECLIDFLEAWKVRAKLVVPILQNINSPSPTHNRQSHTQNHLWGLLIAHQCRSPRQWTNFELELMQELANQIGIAISQAQLLENLEEIVAERTSELTRANINLQQEIDARMKTEEALRRSEEQLRLITNALPALIAYVDDRQYYRFNNKTYETWFGHANLGLDRHHIKDVLGEEFYRENYKYIEAVLSGKTVTYEGEIKTIGDRMRSVSVTYIPHIDGEGDVKGFFSLTSDISDRKAVERMKDEFITIVSHELRTPLTSIHGSLTLLASGRLGTLSAKGQRMLEIADESTKHLVRLVNNILDWQRMESGKVAMEKRLCNAADLMEQALEAMQTTAQQHQVLLEIKPLEVEISVDPDFMIQAFTNLLSNAIKFSEPNSKVWMIAKILDDCSGLKIQHDSIDSGPYVRFEVRDEGQGIPSDKLESIFERFQQVDTSDSRKKGGTGLGLAICRKIIEQHEGQIWVESSIGKGSSFYFILPSMSK
ncbi:ATP-binding protein [Synechococcus sp. PCC 7336]|uniref:ATP-binding protein n=1 Tax=Synechococcus sp. PCC 7336 TaxID=195250 RepID=UPI001930CC97|nr:ATP-binding protein [Synechococcus sp. PCC 7336]